MKQNRMDLIWGVILIALGALFLGQTLGWIPELTAVLWGGLFALTSVLFFGTYLARGRDEWGWLFPAFATGAVAAVILLAETGFDGAFLGSLVLWAVSVPFWVVYAANRQQNWWALIPASVLTIMGFVILLSTAASGEVMGFLVLGAIALPFYFVYFRFQEHWWALIPAGILSSIAVVALMASYSPENNSFYGRLMGMVLFLGWAATFGLLWLGRKRHNTGWAKYPAGALAAIGLLALVMGEAINNLWALALIGAGIWLLIDNYRRPNLKKG